MRKEIISLCLYPETIAFCDKEARQEALSRSAFIAKLIDIYRDWQEQKAQRPADTEDK